MAMGGIRMTAAATARAAAVRGRIEEANKLAQRGGAAGKKLPAIPPPRAAAPLEVLPRSSSLQALQA